MTNAPASRVAVLRTWPEVHAYAPFFAAHARFPAADLATLKSAGPPPIFLLYPAGAPRAALAAHLNGGVLDIDYGFTWGNFDDDAANALVGALEPLLAAEQACCARFGYIPTASALFRRLARAPWLWRDRFPHVNNRYSRSLPASYDALLAEHSKTTRKKLRNALNRLQRDHAVEFCCFTDASAYLADIQRIDQASYQHHIGAGFDASVAHLPGVRAYLLYLDARPAAFYVGSLYRGVFWGLYTGFDPAFREQRPGVVLFQFVLEDLCNDQLAHTIDFGLGDSGYKDVFASTCEPHAELLLFRPSAAALPHLAARLARGAGRALLYSALTRMGLLQRLKTLYRQHHT